MNIPQSILIQAMQMREAGMSWQKISQFLDYTDHVLRMRLDLSYATAQRTRKANKVMSDPVEKPRKIGVDRLLVRLMAGYR